MGYSPTSLSFASNFAYIYDSAEGRSAFMPPPQRGSASIALGLPLDRSPGLSFFVLPRIRLPRLAQIAQEALRHRQLQLFRHQESNPYPWKHPY